MLRLKRATIKFYTETEENIFYTKPNSSRSGTIHVAHR